MKIRLSQKGWESLTESMRSAFRAKPNQAVQWETKANADSSVYKELESLINESIYAKMSTCWAQCKNSNRCQKPAKTDDLTRPDFIFPCQKEKSKTSEDRPHVSKRSLMELLHNRRTNFQKGFIAACFLFVGKDIDEKYESEYFYDSGQDLLSEEKDSTNSSQESVSENPMLPIWKTLAYISFFLFIITFALFLNEKRKSKELILRFASPNTQKDLIENCQAVKDFRSYLKAVEAQRWDTARIFSTETWRSKIPLLSDTDFFINYRMTVKERHEIMWYVPISHGDNEVEFYAYFRYSDLVPDMPYRKNIRMNMSLYQIMKIDMDSLYKEVYEAVDKYYIIPDSLRASKKKEISTYLHSVNFLYFVTADEIIDKIGGELGLNPREKSKPAPVTKGKVGGGDEREVLFRVKMKKGDDGRWKIYDTYKLPPSSE